jgi:hypothetical protein
MIAEEIELVWVGQVQLLHERAQALSRLRRYIMFLTEMS